jgi:GNAT superfamily N-acetyltransferase
MLAGLALRSKAHWQYPAEFIAALRPSFTPSGDDVTAWPVYVLEDDAGAIGYFGFRRIEGEAFLHDMWVEPARIGNGFGRTLWQHAVRVARAAGFFPFSIESDPNAEGFYLAMGARTIGSRVSLETGRTLPLLRYDGLGDCQTAKFCR